MLDAATGKVLWKVKVDEHPISRVTGAPTLYQDRLYVPISSLEERAAGISTVYPCCTFRGSVVALDANTGRRIWKTYVISEPPKPVGKSSKGIQRWAPAGGSVWNSPTIDAARNAIYIGTGDAYTEPAPPTTDAIMALEMDTGKVLWTVQDTPNDAWLSSCEGSKISENCPKDMGPDFDFGSSPILRTLSDGRRILVAGQKSGMVWAHDPDRQGAVVWKAQLVEKLALGMITFGGAADEQKAYFGLRTGGVAAVQLATGERRWFTPVRRLEAAAPSGEAGVPSPTGETAALTAIPGVVFSGGWDGVLRAFSSEDGRLLWEYNTLREFETVNRVAAKGGSMGAPGATVAGGMLYAGSGYVFGAGTPGNVLLAFSVK
jgi:polyvinyl alcohol dehydrogenase (cytochrome)